MMSQKQEFPLRKVVLLASPEVVQRFKARGSNLNHFRSCESVDLLLHHGLELVAHLLLLVVGHARGGFLDDDVGVDAFTFDLVRKPDHGCLGDEVMVILIKNNTDIVIKLLL